MKRVFGLDLLRAVAVLMVLVAHSRFAWPRMNRYWDASIFGYLGVELFFVLSGFLIGGILLRSMPENPRWADLRSFWVRRWFRTLPNYYLFLLLNVGLALWIGDLPRRWGLGAYAVFLQNMTTDTKAFYGESWSLAVEEWFYLSFPVVMFLMLALGLTLRRACLAALLVLLVFSTGLRFAAYEWMDVSWNDVRKAVVYRLDALMVGVLAAYWKANHRPSWDRARWPLVAASAALFAFVASVYWSGAEEAFLRRTFLFNATSLAVFSLLPVLDSWRTAGGLPAKAVERISLWSYSLYLCHLPLQEVMLHVVGKPAGARGVGMHPAVWLAGWTLASIAMAAFVYHFFERPTTDLRSRFDGGRGHVAAA